MPDFGFRDIDGLKSLVYHCGGVGRVAFAAYVAETRDVPEGEPSPETRARLEALLCEACRAVDVAEKAMSAFSGSVLEVDYDASPFARLTFEIARSRSLDVRVRSQGAEFLNALPFDPQAMSELADRMWASASASPDAKTRLSERSFVERRAGHAVADSRSPTVRTTFVGGQRAGCLPPGFDPSCRNIVFFTSSEDKFAALADEPALHPLFRRQVEAVRCVAGIVSAVPNMRLFLRIHPNLKGLPFVHHRSLGELAGEFPALTVIAAEDPCDTYALLDRAEKVIVFGSFLAVEATYWGKPAVVTGPFVSRDQDVAYCPETDTELAELLLRRNLPPQMRQKAICAAYSLIGRGQSASMSARDLRASSGPIG